MIYYLETMEESILLQIILEIDTRMHEHFVDIDSIQGHLSLLAKNKERERLLHVLEEAGLSPDEVLRILSSNSTNDSPNQIMHSAAQGVTIVNISDSQRKIIEANLKREQEVKKSKMQALMNKYNT